MPNTTGILTFLYTMLFNVQDVVQCELYEESTCERPPKAQFSSPSLVGEGIGKRRHFSYVTLKTVIRKVQVLTMTKKAVDRRIQRTRQLLHNALIELIIERGYSPITVQDITDRANVSRTTFYLHFQDKQELLFSSLEAIFADMAEEYHPPSREELQQHEYPIDLVKPGDFLHAAKYADFYRIMLSDKGAPGFSEWLRNHIAKTMLEKILPPLLLPGQPHGMPLEILAQFWAGAEMGLISWWLNNEMPYTPEEMAKTMYSLYAFGAWRTIDLDTPPSDQHSPD